MLRLEGGLIPFLPKGNDLLYIVLLLWKNRVSRNLCRLYTFWHGQLSILRILNAKEYVIVVCVGMSCGYLRVWLRKGATLVRNLLQGLYLLVVLSRVVSRVVHLVARLLPQLCKKEELVGVVSHILEAG